MRIPNSFVPLHVNFDRDKALRRCSLEAEIMFIRSLAHAKRMDSDGRIEDFDLDIIGRKIDNPERVASELVDNLLWITEGDGWIIRSWSKWNAESSDASRHGSDGNHRRWHVDRGIINPDCRFCIAPDIAPTRPDDRPRIAEKSREEKRREEGDRQPLIVVDDSQAPADAGDPFDEWWSHYPKKADKGAARRAFKTALKKTDLDTLTAAADLYAKTANPKFVKNPATWLNAESWANEVPAATGTEENPSVPSYEGQAWMRGGS